MPALRTILTLSLWSLVASANADEGSYIYVTNKAGVARKVYFPPPETPFVPPPVVANSNSFAPATLAPVKPHKPGFEIVRKDPIALLFTRGRLIDRLDMLIAKYPNDERFKADREEMIKQIDAAMSEGVITCITNDSLRTQYRAAVRFWTQNHFDKGVLIQSPPPTNKIYFAPEIK